MAAIPAPLNRPKTIVIATILVCTFAAMYPAKHCASLILGLRGWDSFSARRYDEALKYFYLAEIFDKSNISCHYGRAVTFDALKRYDRALREIEASLKNHPNHSAYLEERANIYYGMHKDKEAIADLTACIKQYRGFYVARAGLYEKLGRLQEALADYEVATNGGESAYAHERRAEIFKQLGRYHEAVLEYSQLIDLFKSTETNPAFISEVSGIVLAQIYEKRASMFDALNIQTSAEKDRNRAEFLRRTGRENALRSGMPLFNQKRIEVSWPHRVGPSQVIPCSPTCARAL